jgi:hypothetical protein
MSAVSGRSASVLLSSFGLLSRSKEIGRSSDKRFLPFGRVVVHGWTISSGSPYASSWPSERFKLTSVPAMCAATRGSSRPRPSSRATAPTPSAGPRFGTAGGRSVLGERASHPSNDDRQGRAEKADDACHLGQFLLPCKCYCFVMTKREARPTLAH